MGHGTCEVKDLEGYTLAIILSDDYREKGITFFSKPDQGQQLGFMRRPKGYKVEAHTHRAVKEEVSGFSEVLFIRSGKIRVDLYAVNGDLRDQRILESGDVIMLMNGGHGVEMLEESEIVEVKQGPYRGCDKRPVHRTGPLFLFEGHQGSLE